MNKGKIKNETEKNKEQEEKEEIAKFKKSKLAKSLIIFTVISVIFFFVRHGFIVKALTFVQACLFIGAWLMGAKVIKEPKKGIRIILIILGFILIIPIIAIGVGNSTTSPKVENIIWSDIALNKVIPQPKSLDGTVIINTDKRLNISIHKVKKEDYEDYVEKCKQKGFTVDTKKNTNYYEAYNQNGYKLRLYYYEYIEDCNISLDNSMEMKENAWVETPLSKLVPRPNSKVGKVIENTEKYYKYYAWETRKEEFSTYASSVLNSGFSTNYKQTDDYFYGENVDGYKVDVRYDGDKIIEVKITAPDKKQEENKTEKPATTEKPKSDETPKKNTSSNGIRPKVKSALDSYEKYFDEYVAFMKKYKSSNGTDFSLISDYQKYLKSYSETMKKFEDMKADNLNDAETKYYIQVQTRINNKLLEVAQ